MISIDLDESGLAFGGTEHGVWGEVRTHRTKRLLQG